MPITAQERAPKMIVLERNIAFVIRLDSFPPWSLPGKAGISFPFRGAVQNITEVSFPGKTYLFHRALPYGVVACLLKARQCGSGVVPVSAQK